MSATVNEDSILKHLALTSKTVCQLAIVGYAVGVTTVKKFTDLRNPFL